MIPMHYADIFSINFIISRSRYVIFQPISARCVPYNVETTHITYAILLLDGALLTCQPPSQTGRREPPTNGVGARPIIYPFDPLSFSIYNCNSLLRLFTKTKLRGNLISVSTSQAHNDSMAQRQ